MNAAGAGISSPNKNIVEYEGPFENVRGSMVMK